MELGNLNRDLGSSLTRRRVVKTGAKLAYAVPLVAATFRLTADGAMAKSCPSGYVFDPSGPDGVPECCACTEACTTIPGTGTYNPATNRCEGTDDLGQIVVCGDPKCDPDIVIATL
jgi:hypothetical protein